MTIDTYDYSNSKRDQMEITLLPLAEISIVLEYCTKLEKRQETIQREKERKYGKLHTQLNTLNIHFAILDTIKRHNDKFEMIC